MSYNKQLGPHPFPGGAAAYTAAVPSASLPVAQTGAYYPTQPPLPPHLQPGLLAPPPYPPGQFPFPYHAAIVPAPSYAQVPQDQFMIYDSTQLAQMASQYAQQNQPAPEEPQVVESEMSAEVAVNTGSKFRDWLREDTRQASNRSAMKRIHHYT